MVGPCKQPQWWVGCNNHRWWVGCNNHGWWADIETITTGGSSIEQGSTIRAGGGGSRRPETTQRGGIEGMSREQVGVADITTTFDRSDFAENLAAVLSQPIQKTKIKVN